MADDTAHYRGKRDNEISFAEYTSRITEMHHRIKNNFQVIVSLFNLQADRTINPEILEILAEMQNRVRAIAYLHEPLYSINDFSAIHFGEYLNAFARELHAFYGLGSRIELQLSLADLVLAAGDAVPLALICNELLSNAMKHAFPEDRGGKLSIALRYRGEKHDESEVCEVEISDDGVGLPKGIEVGTSDTLGFHVIRVLTEQLRGTLDVHRVQGHTSFTVVFPLTKE